MPPEPEIVLLYTIESLRLKSTNPEFAISPITIPAVPPVAPTPNASVPAAMVVTPV